MASKWSAGMPRSAAITLGLRFALTNGQPFPS